MLFLVVVGTLAVALYALHLVHGQQLRLRTLDGDNDSLSPSRSNVADHASRASFNRSAAEEACDLASL